MVIQPMRWSRFMARTSAMPSTGNGLKASIRWKPSRFARFAASSSASSLPNSPSSPRTGSAMRRLLLLAREDFLVLEDRDRRQVADEQKEGHHERPEHPDIGAPVPEARRVVTERGGQEILIQAG